MTTGDARGRPRSLTTLSPVEPGRVAELRRRLHFVAYAPGVGRPLLELGTVQYARWVVFSRLPAPDGSGRPWRLNWSYLLFDATYDGDQAQYVNAFSDLLPLRLTKLFGTCFGFESNVEKAPGSDRRVVPARAFERFIESNTLEMKDAHFWSASPDSVATVRQALAIERATRRCDRRGDLGRTQTEIEAMALGPPATRPTFSEAALGPWRRRLRPATAVNPLLLAIPVEDDGWKKLVVGRVSLPHTHFARVVRLPKHMQQKLGHANPDRLERDYLLFSFDHDGTFESFVAALSKPNLPIRRFFECCVGCPGPDEPFEFRDWIRRHRLKVTYYLAGVPPRPVTEVLELVQDRAQIALTLTGKAAAVADDDR